ncbi:MAG: hypothetical protein AAFV53_14115, partial [Myxococcota bacterium]
GAEQPFLRRGRAYLSQILVDAVARACVEAGLRFPPLPERAHSLRRRQNSLRRHQSWSRADAALERAGHAAWQALSQRGAVVPSFGMTGRFPATLNTIGQRFDTLDDPFEPLVRIWEAGYALEDLNGESFWLIAPG